MLKCAHQETFSGGEAMTLQELIQAVEQLTPQERRELRAYLDEHQAGPLGLMSGTMDVDMLLEAAQVMRAEMDENAFNEMIAAMNAEVARETGS
jgi:hypothetical protein